MSCSLCCSYLLELQQSRQLTRGEHRSPEEITPRPSSADIGDVRIDREILPTLDRRNNARRLRTVGASTNQEETIQSSRNRGESDITDQSICNVLSLFDRIAEMRNILDQAETNSTNAPGDRPLSVGTAASSLGRPVDDDDSTDHDEIQSLLKKSRPEEHDPPFRPAEGRFCK